MDKQLLIDAVNAHENNEKVICTVNTLQDDDDWEPITYEIDPEDIIDEAINSSTYSTAGFITKHGCVIDG